MTPPARPPAIATRIARALWLWSLALGLAVGAAVWAAAGREVDELLDEALRSSAELLAVLAAAPAVAGVSGHERTQHFAWQLVAADGHVVARSARAPEAPWLATPRAGFADVPAWRLFVVAAGAGAAPGEAPGAAARWLVAAQTRDERAEARSEVAWGAVLAALAVGLLAHLALRALVRRELQPLEALSQRLAAWPLGTSAGLGPGASPAPTHTLGPAERAELVPVHEALATLAGRLQARLAQEQAFSAHAAHALRTPLAGIDAQLAVAMREAAPPLAERLGRVRQGAARLRHVVAALLGLFRSADGAAALQRGPVALAGLVDRLPLPGLHVHVAPDAVVDADADLLAAALLNLLDNAQRHGATRAWLGLARDGVLSLRDDGRGCPPARRAALQAALDAERYVDTGGLGLMLADRVARVHGGRVGLPAVDTGFEVQLALGPAPPGPERQPRPDQGSRA